MVSNWPTNPEGNHSTSYGARKLGEILQRLNLKKAPIGSWPYVEIGDIDIENKSIIFKDKKSIRGAIIAPTDSVLVSRVRPTRGAIVYIDKDYVVSSAFSILKPKLSESFSKFLFYWFGFSKNFFQYLLKKQKGSNYPSVRDKDILNFKIHIPPLKIQQKIVERLDVIKKTQELNNKQIALADELFQSLLHRELDPKGKSWEVRKLGEVTQIENGGTPSTQNPKYWNGKVLWLTPKELSNFQDIEIYDTERKITQLGLDSSSVKLLPVGTVLLTSRAPIGYVVIAGKSMATNQGFKNFICKEKLLNNKFLYYFLKYKTKEIQSLGRGATFGEVSKTIVSNIKIPLPPLQIQRQIVEKLSAVQDYKKKLIEQREKLKELFESVLHKSMAGKI